MLHYFNLSCRLIVSLWYIDRQTDRQTNTNSHFNFSTYDIEIDNEWLVTVWLCYNVIYFFTFSGMSVFTAMTIQNTMIQEHVKTNKVLATSVFTTGYAISGFLWPLIYKVFLDLYSWRGAFLLQGAIMINSSILAMIQTSDFWKSEILQQGRISEQKEGECETMMNNLGDKEEQDSEVDVHFSHLDAQYHVLNSFSRKIKQVLKIDLNFWDGLIICAYFLYCCGDTFSHFMIRVRMDYIQLTRKQIVTAMSARGAIGLLRMVPCYLIDKFKFNRTKVASLLSFLLGLLTMISVTFAEFPAILVYFCVWGITQCK